MTIILEPAETAFIAYEYLPHNQKISYTECHVPVGVWCEYRSKVMTVLFADAMCRRSKVMSMQREYKRSKVMFMQEYRR